MPSVEAMTVEAMNIGDRSERPLDRTRIQAGWPICQRGDVKSDRGGVGGAGL
jgi:hypothetical protein